MSTSWPPVAGNDSQSRAAVTQPFAGEAPVVTDSAVADADIAYLQLCALTSAGAITPFVAGTHTGQQAVIAAAAALSGDNCPYYAAGKFNHEAIGWPAGTALDTLPERKGLLIGSMLHLGHLNA